MPFDFKKEYKTLYLPKSTPEIVDVPPMNFIAVRGSGNPNEKGGSYQQAIQILYSIAYTLKMSHKAGHMIPGFFDYVVPPLEGLWWQEGVCGMDYANKSGLHWVSLLRLPDFVSEKELAWAAGEAAKKKKIDCSLAEFLTIEEGLCVQIMHLGPYDSEPESAARMDQYLAENGWQNDFTPSRQHHEIYLSNPERTLPEKRKTVIRHPVKKS